MPEHSFRYYNLKNVKIMKTKLLLSLALFSISLIVNAQNTDEKQIKIGVGLTTGIPMGDYSDYASLALNLDIQGEYTIMPTFAITLNAGYLNFISKGGYGELGIGQIPILLGGKYYFSDKVYGSVQAGVSILTAGSGGSAFAFAPGIGYKISKRFDLMAKYHSTNIDGSNVSFLGIRAGFTF